MTIHATPPNVVRETPDLDCLDFSGETVYGDFRDDLVRDGYAVVKGVLPRERAEHYVGASRALSPFKLSAVARVLRLTSVHLCRRVPPVARGLRPWLQTLGPVNDPRGVPAHHSPEGPHSSLWGSARGERFQDSCLSLSI